ncbi:WG repeat-containing protein [Myroides sp.]|uniref:WG repeat-containing protein n=1 Tax=Myroides sp. TaxID=1874736 RepID=UPI003F3937E8
MKTYLNILFFFLIGQFAFGQVDLEKYNDVTTNEEYIDLLEGDLKRLNRFLNFFSLSKGEVRKPSEVTALKLSFNQHDYETYIDQVAQSNIEFLDILVDNFIKIRLTKDASMYDSLDDIKASIYAKKVYYHDGTTQNIEDRVNLNTNFPVELGLTKSVNKMDVEMLFETSKKLDSLVLPAKVHEKVTYKGGSIEVIEVTDESVLLKKSSTKFKVDDVQAILKNKKRVSSYRSQSSGMHPEEYNQFLKDFILKIEYIMTFANANIDMEFSQFKIALDEKLNKIETEFLDVFDQSDEGVRYLYYEFGEPIDKLVIYSNSEYYEKSISKTLINLQPKSSFVTHDDDKTQIYDLNLKLIKEFNGIFDAINERYFKTKKQYYNLNDKFEMQPLTYYKIIDLTNNFILVQEDDESPLELVDPTNRKGITIDNYEVNNKYSCALLLSNSSYYLLNNSGLSPKKIEDADKVYDASKGYFVVIKNGKYGFINAEGKVVIPVEYDDVTPFSDKIDLLPTDLLFAVKKNDKWGFVDENNKTIIPFMYSDVNGPFSYGIAPVYLDGALGLINLKNEKISKFVNGNYMESTNFGKRTMSLSDGTYDHKGEKKKK